MSRLSKKARADGRCYLTVYVERAEMKELQDYCKVQGQPVSAFMRAEALKAARGMKVVSLRVESRVFAPKKKAVKVSVKKKAKTPQKAA